MLTAYKQKKGTEYRIVNANNEVLAGIFSSESSANAWLQANGYSTVPCCDPQAFSSTGLIEGYQTYPSSGYYDIITPLNVQVSLNVNWVVYDKPNRFNIYNKEDQLLWSSGWKGNADYAGPWGTNLETPNSGTATIVSNKGFKLKVEGFGVGDNWNLTTSCNVSA